MEGRKRCNPLGRKAVLFVDKTVVYDVNGIGKSINVNGIGKVIMKILYTFFFTTKTLLNNTEYSSKTKKQRSNRTPQHRNTG